MGMAYTQAQLLELEAAIASGILTVRYEGPPAREITYQSLFAMESLRARMIRELGKAPGFRLGVVKSGLVTGGGTGTGGFGSGGNP